MQQFLFVVEISYASGTPVGTNVSHQWSSFEAAAQNGLPPALAKNKIALNVWLFDSENALPNLIALSNLAKNCGLVYKSFLLPEKAVSLAK